MKISMHTNYTNEFKIVCMYVMFTESEYKSNWCNHRVHIITPASACLRVYLCARGSNDGFREFYTARSNWFDSFIVFAQLFSLVINVSHKYLYIHIYIRIERGGKRQKERERERESERERERGREREREGETESVCVCVPERDSEKEREKERGREGGSERERNRESE